MNTLRLLCSLLLSAVIVVTAAAQPIIITVRLTQPPPNQLKVADLWKIDLNNQSRQTVRVYLHGTAEELSVPDGIIADANSAEFDCPPGTMRITAAQVSPIDVNESNDRYRDALLSTGNVPTGEYQICVEVVDAETQQVLGRDCKFVTVNRMSVPILIAPPDESEVPDRYPVFTWMASVPPGPGQVIKYRLKIMEIFGKQTPADAVTRNPAWFQVDNLTRTILQYPVSSRSFVKGQRYAWMVEAYEERGAVIVPLGESEVWSFTWNPLGSDAEVSPPKDVTAKPPIPPGECPGDNWDFEIGNLACWEVDGESYLDDPVLDAHPVFGNVGQQGKWWVTSYGPLNADEAMGTMLSQDFKIQNSTIAFLFGGVPDEQCRVELLLEKLDTDTFSFPKRSLPGTSVAWHIAFSTGMRDAAASDRFVPIEWDVLKYLNRNARLLIIDSSKVGHVNADDFRFLDKEKLDTVKYPVQVMAAGENHNLVATPEDKPNTKLLSDFAANVNSVKKGNTTIDAINVVNETSPQYKGTMFSMMENVNFGQYTQGGNEPPMPDLQNIQMSKGAQATLNVSALAALIVKNQIWGWGDNLDKSVGPSLPSVVKEPKQIKGVQHVTALDAGVWNSFAVEKDGTLKVWGDNEYAQLGVGDRTARSTPIANSGITKVAKVSNGAFHTLATNSTGQLWVWGWNRMHGCGGSVDVYTNNTTGQVDSTVFFKIPIPHVAYKSIVDVAAGEAHSLILTLTGQVYAWGVNSHGQTGRPFSEEVTETPQALKIGPNARYVRQIAAGFDHSMALGVDGRVWCWGGNASGQLGDGTTTDRPGAQAVPGLVGIRAIAAGDGFSLALDSSGTVWAWGNNVLGQLGDGTRIGRFTPVQVSRIDAVQGIVAGGAHAMAVRADGGLWTWGTNPVGQIGEGPIVNLSPVPLDPPIGPIRVERLATK